MKKFILSLAAVCCIAGFLPLAAATYDNNEYQRKSRAYSEAAARAYDEGDYDASVEYAREAEKNAELSAAYIERMIARTDAETLLMKAHTRLTWATGIKAERNFAAAYATATSAIAAGDASFAADDFASAKASAQRAIDALAGVKEIVPLPAYYRVERWMSSKDCLWNIASNPAIYGNPFMWEKLYKANKKALKQPTNPDLLMPGMLLAIPSIAGEYREGTYDPSVAYEPFKKP